MILIMGAIFILSDQPGGTFYLPPLPGIDKLAHAVVYGMLAVTIISALSTSFKEKKPRVVLVGTTVFCFFYGISDEFHQYFVPGRVSSGFDVLADVFGAVVVCLFWAGLKKYQ
ncbi:MAG: VanZ family protein [Proteobacteria bacterium]|nr:VanZ family protein [Pseudomonadota bacterium]